MKLLFDQNISHRILRKIPEQFTGSTSVKAEGLLNASDRQIWDFVTQDSDFNDLNSLYGFPPKIIWIRSGNLKTQLILAVLINHFDEISRFAVDEAYGCFEIISMG